MRSRLSLFLNDLTLEEIIYFESELDRRKEKYRKHYSVLAVQTDQPALRPDAGGELTGIARDLRRFITSGAAVGGGTVLAFTPDASLILFQSVTSAMRSASALLNGLPELNGKRASESPPLAVKMGLASGVDTLAPGSPRSVRASVLVRRANQAAWRSPSNTLIMDENSYQETPDRSAAVRMPLELDGHQVYRIVPGMPSREAANHDNGSLLAFLHQVTGAGVSTVKYDMESIQNDSKKVGNWGRTVESVRLILEAYSPRTSSNLQYAEIIAATEFALRMDTIRRLVGNAGLALVRHEVSAATGV